jgi:hypothetical protein
MIKLHVPDQVIEIAEAILEGALDDPAAHQVIETMLANPEITRRQLYHTAFAQGVLSTLQALKDGNLVPIAGSNN